MQIAELIKKAKAASEKAYAPYSSFKVGAVVLANGKYYTGSNIENASYSLTMCAERVAIFSALQEIKKEDIEAVAIYANTNNYISPCGACRQVLAEFLKKDTPIILINKELNYKITNINELLPFQFNGDYLD